ncbi:MAG: metallophosphoesterase [Proteobacteria bacterium]|nr:metallophosphoesterase [Desulfobacula sp.]MBU3952834.1 metallophosphoesterase [Pseudomonadota bacterium]MBU4131060.1 metallophosphoesterase [Pseudomonadota bacterium]
MKQQLSWTWRLLICTVLMACSTSKPIAPLAETAAGPVYPDTRFIVISDLHFYDTDLGAKGKAFQKYLDQDRKLLVLSDEIIGTAIKKIALDPADFVLVAGDLTKDGEKICHQGVARHLQALRKSGKQIFVVPGNHDINNPDSVRFAGDITEPVPSIGPAAFEQIYQDLGYGAAIARDPDSLSYVAEPVKGLRLLALDSNRYKENQPNHHPIIGGAFSDQTLEWIQTQLIAAQKENKAVIVLMHHGIMEHYPANEKFYEDYLVADREKVASLFARYKVTLVFTGHFHAQDVTRERTEDGDIFDIETGSMVTAPCPYRVVALGKNTGGNTSAVISSRFITAIPSLGEGFADYAATYVFEGTKKMANTALGKYKVSKEQQALINSQVASAYSAHLKGDETKPDTAIDTTGFGYWLRFVAWIQEDLIDGWWTDLAPRDNNLVIDLATGKVTAGE